MKKWPSENGLVHFDDLVEPACEAIAFAYRLERQNADSDIPWNGCDVGEKTKVCSRGPVESLEQSNLAYELEDQGRDALHVILRITIQTAIEQGRRMAAAKAEDKLETARLYAKALGDALK